MSAANSTAAPSPIPPVKRLDGTAAPRRQLGGPGAHGFLTAMCDGSVRYVRGTIGPKPMALLIDRANGNVILQGWEITSDGNLFDDERSRIDLAVR